MTGSAGFIGSTLAADNDGIAVDDTYPSTPGSLDPAVEFVAADIVDYRRIVERRDGITYEGVTW